MSFAISTSDWDPTKPHGVSAKPYVSWSVTRGGILVEGEATPRRTKGEPATIRKLVQNFGPIVTEAANKYDVDPATIYATLANESGGNVKAERYEKAIDDYSFGLMQTLTKTAASIIKKDTIYPWSPTPKEKDWAAWREYLFNSKNSIFAGVCYLRYLDMTFNLRHDPVLMYASYNAGSLRPSTNTTWGFVYYGEAIPHFVSWLGDACSIING